MRREPKARIEEWFALEHQEGTWPPGLWACAGRYRGEVGVYVGAFDEVQNSIPNPAFQK